MSDRARNVMVGRRTVAPEPSQYVKERNAQKDWDAQVARAAAEQNRLFHQQMAEENQRIALAHLKNSNEQLRIRQLQADNKVKADEQVLQEKRHDAEMEAKFLAELGQLKSTSAASLEPALRLMAKYHVSKFSESAKDYVRIFNEHLNEAVHQEFIRKQAEEAKRQAKEEADAAKAEAAKQKKIDDLRKSLGEHKAALEGAIMEDAAAKDQNPDQKTKPGVAYKLGLHREEIRNIAQRLKEVDPVETAAITEEADAMLQQDLKRQDAEMAAAFTAKKLKPGTPEFKSGAAKLNEIKRQITGYNLINEDTGEEIKPQSLKQLGVTGGDKASTAASPVALNAPPVPATDSSSSDSWNEGQQPPVSPTTPASTAPPSGSQVIPVSNPAPQVPTAPQTAAVNPLDELAKRRDEAIALRNKNLDVLTNEGAFSTKIAPASDAAMIYGQQGADLSQQYTDDLLARSEAVREASRKARAAADAAMANARPDYTQAPVPITPTVPVAVTPSPPPPLSTPPPQAAPVTAPPSASDTSATPPVAPTAPPAPDIHEFARQALKAGAPMEAVKAKLIQLGGDPSKL